MMVHQILTTKPPLVVVYYSSNALVLINAVALHWVCLVVGWVTPIGQVNCLII